MNLLGPEWTERLTDTETAGEDHLGVEAVAQGYQQFLVPGIISTTDHARYYSFYCWILFRYINQPDSPRTSAAFGKHYFKRHELAFISACYSHHLTRRRLGGLVGGGVNNYKARQIWDSGDPIPLDNHLAYFSHSQGGFGQYYRPVMETMGLIAEPESPRWIYRLTPRGKELALAFAESIADTTYSQQLASEGQVAQLTHVMATEYGHHGCLCAEAMAHSADRTPLLNAFFRFDQTDTSSLHVRRRLTLALLLDLVHQSGTLPLRHVLRRTLYLGRYQTEQPYRPHPALDNWYHRWRMVQVRQCYTAALQALWAVFYNRLRDERHLTFAEFMDWTTDGLPVAVKHQRLTDYLTDRCAAVGLPEPWQEGVALFHEACQNETGLDEITLFGQLLGNSTDPGQVVALAVQILSQLFLRHYEQWQSRDAIWQEVAAQERLPLNNFMTDLAEKTHEGCTVTEWLTGLYRHYCIGQHEMVAMNKLSQNQYNTFKFYYENGSFTWAANPPSYQVPLRYAGLRLSNALTILTDLGLVLEDAEGLCRLSGEGEEYLARATEGSHGD